MAGHLDCLNVARHPERVFLREGSSDCDMIYIVLLQGDPSQKAAQDDVLGGHATLIYLR